MFKLFNKIYLVLKGYPIGTQLIEYDYKKFIIKKHNKIDQMHSFKNETTISKCISEIEHYGNIMTPIEVSKCNFSDKFIIRKNIEGYYALNQLNIKKIPLKIIV
jgi:hypothetical protein